MAKRKTMRMGKSRRRPGGGATATRRRRARALTGPTFFIFGLVRDRSNGRPLNRMLVKIVGGTGTNFGKEARTGPLGVYIMPGIKPERILIEASGGGFPPLEKDRTIRGNTNINFDM
jgi:hypothetical protein